MPFLLNFFFKIQDPLSHSFLLCEWCTSSLSSRTDRIFRQLSTYDSASALMYNAFHRSSLLLICLLGICFLAWDHLYLIYYSPCFFPWVLCCHPLDILSVTWMEPQYSILDSLNMVYFIGVKQDFNAHRILRENCYTGRNSFI